MNLEYISKEETAGLLDEFICGLWKKKKQIFTLVTYIQNAFPKSLVLRDEAFGEN